MYNVRLGPDPEARTILAGLSQAEVRKSPEADTRHLLPKTIACVVGTDEFPLLAVGAETAAAASRVARREHCACLSTKTKKGTLRTPTMHVEPQREDAPGWLQIKRLIEQAKEGHTSVFEPSAHL